MSDTAARIEAALERIAALEVRLRAATPPLADDLRAALDELCVVLGQQSAELCELARYRSLVERIPALTYSAALDAASSTIYVSPQIGTLLGFTQAEWLADPRLWLRQVHPDDRAHVLDDLARARAGDAVDSEYRMLARDGQVLWFREISVLARDERGQPQCLQGIMFDITARKRREEALRETERNLRLFAENTADVFFAYDMNRRLLYVNAAFEQLTGYTIAELRERDFIPYLHADDEARMMALFEANFRGQSFADVECRVITRDGVMKWLSASGGPIFDGAGAQVGVQGVERDITARKQAEEARRAIERQLQDGQRLESLGALAGGIAHDFNNLLAIVLGNTGMALLDLPPDSPAHAAIAQIEAAARRAAGLTQQMLAYAGRGSVSAWPLDLNALVSDLAPQIEAAHGKRIALEYRLAPDLPEVEADAAQLRQVIVNLVNNAIEAIGERSGVITIATSVRHSPPVDTGATLAPAGLAAGDYVCVEVADTGAGMDEETQRRAFEPFFTTKFPGRGLGLAAALGISRSHGGAITVRSAPGDGSTFTVMLPAPHEAAQPEEEAREPATRSGTILVIDAEEYVRAVVLHTLQREGFSVLTAENVAAGAELLRAHADRVACALVEVDSAAPDVLIGDLRRIKPGLPVLLTGDYLAADAAAQVASAAHAGALQKPFAPDVLREGIRRLLGQL